MIGTEEEIKEGGKNEAEIGGRKWRNEEEVKEVKASKEREKLKVEKKEISKTEVERRKGVREGKLCG